MKKTLTLLLAIAVLLSVPACSAGFKKADTVVEMKSFTTEEYRGIEWEGRRYVPFCAISKEDMSLQIGIVDGDEKDLVFTYREYPETEWLAEYYHSGLMDGPFLLREESVKEIPDGLYSEYEWNQERIK